MKILHELFSPKKYLENIKKENFDLKTISKYCIQYKKYITLKLPKHK